MPNTKSGHIQWGSWDFDYDVSGFEGLSLLNGTYRGRSAIGKFSMPVIRVRYLVDGGALDWRRPLGKGAGPYADRLWWKLGGDHGLQKISNMGDQYVGVMSSVRDGGQWLELGIYGRIGAYHLYHCWHLSEDGWIMPRIWSKGLTSNMDHWHHPYWRFDFDIDGTDNHRVHVRNFGAWRFYTRESNDVKNADPRANTAWFVRNEQTNQGAFVIPGDGDGVADGFSRIDMGVRRYNRDEELHPWRYQKSPWGSWDWQFDTGGLQFLNNESVDRTDVVFWYVSHMFHRAQEGKDHWHSSGPWIKFHYDAPPARPAQDFGIVVNVRRHQTGNDTTVRGRGFTPGGSVQITFNGIPNRVQIKRTRYADSAGKFTFTEQFPYTSRNPDDAFGKVDIFAFDVTTGLMASYTVTSAYWVP
jgi:hypothetical protein